MQPGTSRGVEHVRLGSILKQLYSARINILRSISSRYLVYQIQQPYGRAHSSPQQQQRNHCSNSGAVLIAAEDRYIDCNMMLEGGDITIHEAFGKPLVPPLSSSRKAIILVQYSYHGTIVVERRHIRQKPEKPMPSHTRYVAWLNAPVCHRRRIC